MGRYAARAARSIAPGVMVALTGCLPSTPGGFDSPDPTARLAAIADAGASEDESAVPELIEQLESSDPGARLLAIRSLERITGQTLGYDYAAQPWERAAPVRRWRRWAEQNGYVGAEPARAGESPDPDTGDETGNETGTGTGEEAGG